MAERGTGSCLRCNTGARIDVDERPVRPRRSDAWKGSAARQDVGKEGGTGKRKADLGEEANQKQTSSKNFIEGPDPSAATEEGKRTWGC